MKVVDIERVVILMHFIQYGWDEERKQRFDDTLIMMLETQCEDLDKHDKQIRDEVIDEYSSELFKVIEMATVNCKFDFTIDDLHNLKIVIKGLAEQLKENNNG